MGTQRPTGATSTPAPAVSSDPHRLTHVSTFAANQVTTRRLRRSMSWLLAVSAVALLVVATPPSAGAFVPAPPPSASDKAQTQRGGFTYRYSLRVTGGVTHYAFRNDGVRNGISSISVRMLAVTPSARAAGALVYVFITPATARPMCRDLGTSLARTYDARLVSCRVVSARNTGRKATIQMAVRVRL